MSEASQKKNVDHYLEEQFKENSSERVQRIIDEYQVLGDVKYGEKLLKNLVDNDASDVSIKYSYAMYCIKNKLKKAEDVLSLVEDYLSFNKDDGKVRLEYLLLLIASETEENCKKAWILLRELISSCPEDVKNLVLACFLFNDCLKNESLG